MSIECNDVFVVFNFICNIIDDDNCIGKWGGCVEMCFLFELNGYLYIGYVKSICLNFSVVCDYGGVCYLCFDDMNLEKESVEYVDLIVDVVCWFGFDWCKDVVDYQYFVSDYYDKLYEFVELLIKCGKVYVDSQSVDEMCVNCGLLIEGGKLLLFCECMLEENFDLFCWMKVGEFKEGEYVLCVKIDMVLLNMNMCDLVIYWICYVYYYCIGDVWCVYLMYDYMYCILDVFEGIMYLLCMFEFEDYCLLYDWVLNEFVEVGVFMCLLL